MLISYLLITYYQTIANNNCSPTQCLVLAIPFFGL